MSSKIKLQIAFQGGGAKLVALLAVVEVLQELERSGEIEITRVSGTSAGAIAATILASDINAQDVAKQLADKGKEYVNKILPTSKYPRKQEKIAKLQMFYDIVNSRPMANISALREVLASIFKDKENSNNKLRVKKPISIIAADLHGNEKRVFNFNTSSCENSLLDAITDSCALPIFFRTSAHLAGSSLVDGGLVENLPISELINEEDEFGKAFAVSFNSDTTNFNVDNFLLYSLCLLNTAILNSCKRSVELVGESNVYYIKTDISTFDFDKALDILPEKSDYINIKNDARNWFLNAIQILHSTKSKMTMTDVLCTNFDIYKAFHFNRKRKLIKGAMVITARCIANKGEPVYSLYDDVLEIYEISPIDERIYCIAISSQSKTNGNVFLVPDIIIEDNTGKNIKGIIIPAIDSTTCLAPNGDNMKDILIYFERPMEPSSTHFIITKREMVRECMKPLKENKCDYLVMKNSRPEVMEKAELILNVPINTPKIRAVERAENSKSFDILDKNYILSHYGKPPLGFRTEGWRVDNLMTGEIFAIDLILQ